jgi:hypothetical protein
VFASSKLDTGIKSKEQYSQSPSLLQNPFITLLFDQRAATKAAPNPSNPPIPAIIAGAAFVETGAGPLEVELAAEVALLEALLVEALLVVAGTDVVTAVTEVVEAGTEEEEVVTVAVDDGTVETDVVVVAEAEAREAEKAEQRPRPTEAATARSDWLHAEIKQGAAEAWMEEKPEPHWQASSESWQPAAEIADVRQGICSKGCQ